MTNRRASSLGAEITIAQLEQDPHRLLASLREREPVAWIPPLDGWLVTRHDLAIQVMRDSLTSPSTIPGSRRLR